ncbi:hypothetical protein, partial [Shewanella sp. BC20]|uniref:hypothetical protein n=1 Tax=Shewanella sp. BC20 TaxID=2004459 RepID=UPI001C639F77
HVSRFLLLVVNKKVSFNMGVIQAIALRDNHHRQRRWFWDDNKKPPEGGFNTIRSATRKLSQLPSCSRKGKLSL